MTHWKDVSIIHQGGFGTVSIIQHPKTKKKYARKSLKKSNNIMAKARYQKHFINELHYLKKVDHPHIIKVIEHQFSDKDWYIITELAAPGDLYDYIVNLAECLNGQSLSTLQYQDHHQKSYQWAAQLLSAIDYLHDRHIYHCDIKLENILLKGNYIQLIDFGFATQHQKSSVIVGSKPYIAPELRKGLPIPYSTEKADLYSLGVTLTLMLVDLPQLPTLFSLFHTLYPLYQYQQYDIMRMKIKKCYFQYFTNRPKDIRQSIQNLCDPLPKIRQLPPVVSLFQSYNNQHQEQKQDEILEVGTDHQPIQHPSHQPCCTCTIN